MSRSEESITAASGSAVRTQPFVYSPRRSLSTSSAVREDDNRSDTAARPSSGRGLSANLLREGVGENDSILSDPAVTRASSTPVTSKADPTVPGTNSAARSVTEMHDLDRSDKDHDSAQPPLSYHRQPSDGDRTAEAPGPSATTETVRSVSDMIRPYSCLRSSASSSSLNSSRIVVGAEELVSNFKNSLVAQRRRHLERHGESLSVMCIGESGAGKTTALASLFVQPMPRRSVSTQSTKRIEESSVDLIVGQDDAAVNIHVRTIDSPGYGDDVDVFSSFKRITDYIEEGFEKIIELEKKADRPDPKSLDRIAGVDAVLYFINPHRLKRLDIEFLKRVHKLASVLPVIAKADTLTSDELAEFRNDVAQKLEREGIEIFAGPYAVISCGVTTASPDGDDCEGTVYYSRGREYAWGTAIADNPEHSDLPMLRQMLLTDGLLELHDARRSKFEAYRKRKVLKERRSRKSFLGRMSSFQRWIFGIGVHTLIGLSAIKLVQLRLQALQDSRTNETSLRINQRGWPFGRNRTPEKLRTTQNSDSKHLKRSGDTSNRKGLFGFR